jgi:hypothetical protein
MKWNRKKGHQPVGRSRRPAHLANPTRLTDSVEEKNRRLKSSSTSVCSTPRCHRDAMLDFACHSCWLPLNPLATISSPHPLEFIGKQCSNIHAYNPNLDHRHIPAIARSGMTEMTSSRPIKPPGNSLGNPSSSLTSQTLSNHRCPFQLSPLRRSYHRSSISCRWLKPAGSPWTSLGTSPTLGDDPGQRNLEEEVPMAVILTFPLAALRRNLWPQAYFWPQSLS